MSFGEQIAASSQPNTGSPVEPFVVPVTPSLQEGGLHLQSAFFYGTLMHPVLRRVIRNDGSHLVTVPAVLYSYIRRLVKGEDYPAIIASGSSDEPSSKAQSPSVRGVLVQGLTSLDLSYLDSFEGDEYVREKVVVSALGQFQKIHPQAEPNPPLLGESQVPAKYLLGFTFGTGKAPLSIVETGPMAFSSPRN
ncbi:hypothetical protein BS47DRAFT_1393859 [Hydnum rufescens UP504]|uniref:Putative gamma-glutamylcyclotransferase n=1 Tax=Hydnum rufescens UP504 TaxID=1448309 RepID=A0A9P6DT41_9AGAM|nr:hypothetical protein BS47DRAFT_1393859 [Hydnum rufescens UP504]